MVIYAAQTRIVPLKAPTDDTLNLPYTGLFFMHKPYPWSPSSIDHIDRISLNSTMPFTYRHRARTGSGYAQPERACLTLTKK